MKLKNNPLNLKLESLLGLDADPDVLATAAILAAGIGYNLSISIKLKEKDKEVNISNIQYNRIYNLGEYIQYPI